MICAGWLFFDATSLVLLFTHLVTFELYRSLRRWETLACNFIHWHSITWAKIVLLPKNSQKPITTTTTTTPTDRITVDRRRHAQYVCLCHTENVKRYTPQRELVVDFRFIFNFHYILISSNVTSTQSQCVLFDCCCCCSILNLSFSFTLPISFSRFH